MNILTSLSSSTSNFRHEAQRLTSLEVDKVVNEYKEVIKIIAHLKGILESRKQRMDIIKEELLNIQELYGDES